MKVHWIRIGNAGGKPVHMHPLKLISLIFGGIGLLFTLLGGAFIACTVELLPQVFSAAAWLGDTPDELALPVCGVVFGVIGLVFLVAGVIMLLVMRRQRKLREELKQYGTRVTGMVTDITIDRTYQINGRSPLRIQVQAEHPFTREAQTLRSGPVWETTLYPGDAVEVLFDPQNEKKHVILLEQNK